ncbi:hypothetical protein SAMN05518672_1092 [Chitinophaga sp. CF118]|nr:hypothetical protein SAMN05518672_1092 [Chitinophaga sp. CF118]
MLTPIINGENVFNLLCYSKVVFIVVENYLTDKLGYAFTIFIRVVIFY